MNNLALSLLQDEFDKELHRTQNIDKKAEYFMTIIVLIATLFIPMIPISNIVNKMLDDNCFIMSVGFIGFMLLAYAIIDMIYAFKKLYNAYNTNEFRRIEIEKIIVNSQNLSAKEVNKICKEFSEIIQFNKSTNNDKLRNAQEGIRHCVISILMLTLTTLLLKCIML